MNTDRVNIFHVADCDAVIVAVAHDLVLNFLPACDAALDKYLPDHTVFETFDNNLNQFFFVIGNTAAGSAHSICRTDDNRVSDFICKADCGLNILNNRAFRDRLTELLHCLLEKLTVFSFFNGFQRCAKKLYSVFFKNALFS